MLDFTSSCRCNIIISIISMNNKTDILNTFYLSCTLTLEIFFTFHYLSVRLSYSLFLEINFIHIFSEYILPMNYFNTQLYVHKNISHKFNLPFNENGKTTLGRMAKNSLEGGKIQWEFHLDTLRKKLQYHSTNVDRSTMRIF